MNRLLQLAVVSMLLCLLSAVSSAQENAVKNEAKKKNQKSVNAVDPPPEADAERQAELYGFVDENHPDLRSLLEKLETKHPAQHRKAMKTLNRQYTRLVALKNKDPERHEIALAEWKIHSQVELLTAQMSVRKADQEDAQARHEETLRSLLGELHAVQLRSKTLELTRVKARVEKLTADRERLEASAEEEVEKKFTAQMKRVQRQQQLAQQRKKKKPGGRKSEKKQKPPAEQEQKPSAEQAGENK